MNRFPFGGRTDQHKAALKRKADALVLRANKKWQGAMYILGYAVECSIKARLMEQYGVHTLERLEEELSRRFKKSVDIRTHSFEYLLQFSGHPRRVDRSTARVRAVCNQWSPSWRYSPADGSKEECDKFFAAVDVFLRYIAASI